MLVGLPTELLHLIGYGLRVLSAADVVRLAGTCKRLQTGLLGSAHGKKLAQALLGFDACVEKRLWKGALVALAQVPAREQASFVGDGGVTSRMAVVVAARERDEDWLSLVSAMAATGAMITVPDGAQLLEMQWVGGPLKIGAVAVIVCGGEQLVGLASELLAVISGVSRAGVLCAAAAKGFVRLISQLLRIDDGTDVVQEGQCALAWACAYGHDAAVRVLLNDRRINLSAYDNAAFRYAAAHGQTAVLALLLKDRRVDPSAGNNEALRVAIKGSHRDVVALLAGDARVDPSVSHNHAIRWASRNGYDDIVMTLLADDRVDPGSYGNQAIQSACDKGHTRVVELLLADDRVDPAAADNYAFRAACDRGWADVVSLLLGDRRVDPTDKDNYGLRFAARRINAAAENNYALCWASRAGHVEVVKILLGQACVDPTANNYEAVRQASENEFTNVVSVLCADARVQPEVVARYWRIRMTEERVGPACPK
ncbi:uncharacterized protein AMSG_08957 [Thecamonas trahens ATCC 50062]|uniref:F-box domain-containing protein n=1 Tax=Thecamonas trahens ATCC 50062 TaxID=461836 RepID=A0A0L0DKJ3_THETB|nr:hypothetical protein AMSG_08957 [Thecamonas trahens ATCC 50062]KNC52817.1 hypothetical protein AMSG_08957 [Thecamonas trahens ATCC 50062]|eukprot:XP_013754923.1 hypothetical protein AMSG_08957 [Thecamonas trahens ATCC 50062]